MTTKPDIVIIGSGIGGATVAAGLAPSGAAILILEAGGHIGDSPDNRDQRAIFQQGRFRPDELWYEPNGHGFNPGNYYYVGGNSKLYGAVLTRYRREDFQEMQHLEGVSPAWPFPYEELEPWYSKAEQLYQVRGSLGEDPTEPAHSLGYPFPPVPDEAPIAKVKLRLRENGFHPYALPLGVDLDRWLSKGKTPWDAHPHRDDGKMDAETAALARATEHPNVMPSNPFARDQARIATEREIHCLRALREGRRGAQRVAQAGYPCSRRGAIRCPVAQIRRRRQSGWTCEQFGSRGPQFHEPQ